MKGDDTYPYWMNDITSMAWMKGKRKLGIGYKSNSNAQVVLKLETFIRDTFTSHSIKEHSFYDSKKINALVNGFFIEKNYGLASQLGWLIGFELFRKQLK